MRKSLFLLFVIVSICGAAVAGETGVIEAPSYRMPGEFDRDAYAAEQQRLLTWLVAEQVQEGVAEPISIKLTEQEMQEIELGRDVHSRAQSSALLVGVVKPVAMTFDLASPSHGAAERTADGGVVWSAAIHSDFAAGLRVHFEDFSLPDGYELWLYSEHGGVRGPYTGRGPLDTGEFWSHIVAGPDAVLQLRGYGAAAITRNISLKVTELAHEGRDAGLKDFCSYNEYCIENANCPGVPGVVDDAKAAVALMRYLDKRRTYICSGGLINSTANPGTPYFLTANHCIDDNKAAGTLETWFQFTQTCGDSDCPEQWVWTNPNTLGATVVATNPISDFTLLQLSEGPPGGSLYLGWTTASVIDTGATLYRISHPSGAPQAYSMHEEWDPDDNGVPICSGWERGNWIYHQDQIGATEGGSSGSPVVNAAGQVVGQLSGGCGYNVYETCDKIQNSTVDGAFAAYYNQVAAYLGTGIPCTDADNDGVCADVDCDDDDPLNFPGNTEQCSDLQDNDCDGLVDDNDPECNCPDADEDNYTDEACGGLDCDDTRDYINPDALEVCDDGFDNDCNGLTDAVDPVCAPACLPAGADCSTGSECCSGRCHPRWGCR